MSEVKMGGGWGPEALRHASPGFQRQVALSDLADKRADALAERDKEHDRQLRADDNVRLSNVNAQARGEHVGLRELLHGSGRTVQDMLNEHNAISDRQDRREAARIRRMYPGAEAASADLSGTTTVPLAVEPSPALVAARAHADRAKADQARRAETRRIAGETARNTARSVVGSVIGKLAQGLGQR
jgi:hypothetical protein